MKKRVKKGPPKQEFKHPSNIPFPLREKNINTLELANEWQGYLIDGRKKGIQDDSYAWAIWHTKYYWSRMDKLWKVRDLSKPLPGECKDTIIEDVITCFRLTKMNRVNWGYQYVEELKKKLEAIISGQKDVESKLKPKDSPDEEKNGDQSKEELDSQEDEPKEQYEHASTITIDDDEDKGEDGIDEPI